MSGSTHWLIYSRRPGGVWYPQVKQVWKN